jgi:hypothetical protein
MNVLIGCEVSGVIREAFLARGHSAVSADLLPAPPASDPDQMHYHGDVRDLIREPWLMLPGGAQDCGNWDLFICHPDCTRLANSGVQWLARRNLWDDMLKAREFFYQMWTTHIPKVCIENPIPHGHADLPAYSQIIQPWQFGEDASKATCLWLRGLPKLKPTKILEGGRKARRANQTPSGQNKLGPSPDRAAKRAETYAGIAAAMAEQWGAR